MKFGYSAYQILRVERNASRAQILAAHQTLSEALTVRSDLQERVRINLQRSLDDALYTLSDSTLRADHDAWIARHENGPRVDGAHAVLLPAHAPGDAATGHASHGAAVPGWFDHARAWLARLRRAGSAVRMASRTLL